MPTKRNLKAILRQCLGRNAWDPFSLEPVEFVELNFNFHPRYIERQVASVGFELRRTLPVSWLRLGLLKRAMPTALLAGLDRALQATGWALSPSVFLDLRLDKADKPPLVPASDDALDILRCPLTGSRLRRHGDTLVNADGLRWGIEQGVYDFRRPLA